MRRACIALLFAAGCGESYVVVNVDSELEVPAETNAIEVLVRDGKQAVLADVTELLLGDRAFPMSIGLSIQDGTPQTIRVRVTAMLGEEWIARAERQLEWVGGETVETETIVLELITPAQP